MIIFGCVDLPGTYCLCPIVYLCSNECVGVASGAWAYIKIFRAVARLEHPPTEIPRNATDTHVYIHIYMHAHTGHV